MSSIKPPYVGQIFREKILDKNNITITDAAKCIGVTRKALSEFVNGNSRCSKTMARRIADATNTSSEMWIKFQAKCDIWEAENMELPNPVKKFYK